MRIVFVHPNFQSGGTEIAGNCPPACVAYRAGTRVAIPNMARSFCDPGKNNYWGPRSEDKVDFHFDSLRKIAPAQMEDWESVQDRAAPARARTRKQAALAHCEEPLKFVKARGRDEEQMIESLEPTVHEETA